MNIETKPLTEIINELTILESDIKTKIILYNKLIKEINKRFPLQITKETFKELEFKRRN